MDPQQWKDDYNFTFKMRAIKYARELIIILLGIIGFAVFAHYFNVERQTENGLLKLRLGPATAAEVKEKYSSITINNNFGKEEDCDECQKKKAFAGCISIDCIKEPEKCKEVLGIK